jgi:hypothetical protein
MSEVIKLTDKERELLKWGLPTGSVLFRLEQKALNAPHGRRLLKMERLGLMEATPASSDYIRYVTTLAGEKALVATMKPYKAPAISDPMRRCEDCHWFSVGDIIWGNKVSDPTCLHLANDKTSPDGWPLSRKRGNPRSCGPAGKFWAIKYGARAALEVKP